MGATNGVVHIIDTVLIPAAKTSSPTNEAFAKIPSSTLNTLLEPKNRKQLDAILEYHVVAGAAVYSKDLKASQQVKTLEGQQILVTKGASGVPINGLVHIIDTVLIPAAKTSSPTKSIVELAAG